MHVDPPCEQGVASTDRTRGSLIASPCVPEVERPADRETRGAEAGRAQRRLNTGQGVRQQTIENPVLSRLMLNSPVSADA